MLSTTRPPTRSFRIAKAIASGVLQLGVLILPRGPETLRALSTVMTALTTQLSRTDNVCAIRDATSLFVVWGSEQTSLTLLFTRSCSLLIQAAGAAGFQTARP